MSSQPDEGQPEQPQELGRAITAPPAGAGSADPEENGGREPLRERRNSVTINPDAEVQGEAIDGEDAQPELRRRLSSASVNSRGTRLSRTQFNSKISTLVKRGSTGISFQVRPPRATTKSVAEMVDVAVGDQCEAISLVTVRKETVIESDVVMELPIGTLMTIKEVGEGRRVKVQTLGKNSVEGWISSKTKLNEPLVVKQRPDDKSVIEPGTEYVVKSIVTVREEQSLESEILTELQPGTTIVVEEIGDANSRRAKVTGSGNTGWISTVTNQGEMLIGKPGDIEKEKETSGSLFGASSSKIKNLLEAARSGDMALLKSVVEGDNRTTSRFSSRPNLNASDIRGKTALIYAAAFGNKDIVEYLLSRTREVDVNSVDDTQKSALHHASKRARTRRQGSFDDIQAGIVSLLLQSGSYMEARDHNGCTALMFSVANGDELVASQLLTAQANVNVKDFEGNMPLDYALNFKHQEMEAILMKAGAKSSEQDSSDDEKDSNKLAPPSPRVGKLSIADRAPSPRNNNSSAKGEADASPRTSQATLSPTSLSVGSKKKEKDPSEKKLKKSKTDKTEGKEDEAEDGKEKKKKKGDKDGKKTTEKKKKKKGVSHAMSEAVDDTYTEAASKVTVQEPAKEEEDDKTRALRKLKVVLEDVTAHKELEAAIQQAEAAGAVEEELQEAVERVKDLKARAKARDNLKQAKDDKDVQALKEAIAKAEEMNLPAAEVEDAKEVLAVEEPKVNARARLHAASKAGQIPELKVAIEEGKRVNLTVAELAEFESLLEGAQNKEAAEKALKEAIERRQIPPLKFAIQQGREAGVDQAQLEEAEAVLRVEEPKQEAREILAEAVKANTKQELRHAIDKGKEVGLEPRECKEAEEALAAIEERERLLAAVKQSVEDSLSAQMDNITSVKAAKESIAVAIKQALDMGVPETELQEAEIRRKKLHNTVEDLKGSIRVFCRIRPLSTREKNLGDTVITKQTNPITLQVGSGPNPTNFQFDSVWTPGTQDEVFEDCRDLVQSALDGYNVTLFAYGQTGAGKTFTMAGVPGQLGVSPRTITELYNLIDKNKARAQFTIMGSMLELYRQDLVDLLVKGNPAYTKQKLNVRVDKSNMVSVEHLTQEECKNAAELEALMERGNKSRTVAATAMNSESSRSHLVLMVQVISVNRETGDQLRGKLLIVDLAGSERLKKSQTTADAQKESIEINKSLTALGDVIEALTKKSKAVPYRNHKLTQLMQDSLGGTAKTLMFVNCSPASSNESETLMSLKYAARAKNVTNATAKNRQSMVVDEAAAAPAAS